MIIEMTPVYWGILAGCVVFIMTVAAVITLLIKGGSIERMREQEKVYETKGEAALRQALLPQPMLYDELIDAAASLPPKPALPPEELAIIGRLVDLLPIDLTRDAKVLYDISSGAPTLGVAYDPRPLWTFLGQQPCTSVQEFGASPIMQPLRDGLRLKIVDKELGRVIGFVSIVDNSPRNLRVGLGDMWFAPNHTQGAATEGIMNDWREEVIFILLQHLFQQKYRRVELLLNVTDPMIHLAQAMGFKQEGVLRKHMIVLGCNRDTAVLSIVNNDWRDGVRAALEKRIYGATTESKQSAIKVKGS